MSEDNQRLTDLQAIAGLDMSVAEITDLAKKSNVSSVFDDESNEDEDETTLQNTKETEDIMLKDKGKSIDTGEESEAQEKSGWLDESDEEGETRKNLSEKSLSLFEHLTHQYDAPIGKSGTMMQMSGTEMDKSIGALREDLRLKIGEAKKNPTGTPVAIYLARNEQKLPKPVQNMLKDVEHLHPDLTAENIPWLILGWDMRGEHNIIETKNLHQSMSELVTNQIANQNTFVKTSQELINGFRSCHKEVLSLVGTLSSQIVNIPKPPQEPIRVLPEKTKAQSHQSQIATTSTRQPTLKTAKPSDMKEAISILYTMLNKNPEDLFEHFDKKKMREVSYEFIKNMDDSAWADLWTGEGRMATWKVLCDVLVRYASKQPPPSG